ncbi:MAG TPA: cell division protein FtsA, partial [Tepidisphaeraceae bacterium]|nr:cell division protein FtsA [Tepidisphaeraceae bacterium]
STGGGNKSGRRNCHAPDKNVSPTPASYRAIVDIGAAATVVAIMSGGQLTFIKSIAIGGRHFNQAVSRSLGLGSQEVRELRRHFSAQAGGNEAMRQGAACAVFDATRGSMEELAHRVAACFRYQAITFPGRQPKQVFLVGGEAADPNLLAALTPALPVTPVALDPLEGVDCSAMKPADCQSPRGQWSVAAAISRCAGLQSIGADLDFLPCIRLRSWRWPGLSAA